jgi:hypothetical protein
MSTQINIVVNSGGLLDRNAQQTSANRQAKLTIDVQAKAAEEGIAELEKRRLQQSLDRLTGKLFPGGNNASKIRRIDQEPAAFRFNNQPIVMGNAWTYNSKQRNLGEGVNYPTYVGCGNGSTWVSFQNFAREDWIIDVAPENIYTKFGSDFEAFSAAFYDLVSTEIPAPSWATQPLQIFRSPTLGYVYYYIEYYEASPFVRIWFAEPFNVLDTGGNQLLEFTEALPAGGANAYVINYSSGSSWQHWNRNIYIGEIEGYPLQTTDGSRPVPIYQDYLYNLEEGRDVLDIQKLDVAYVTPTTVTKIATPGWVTDKYIPEVHGRIVRSEFGDPGLVVTRIASIWYRTFKKIDEANENSELMASLTQSQYATLIWPGVNWITPEPFNEQYLFTAGRPQFTIEFPEREDQEWPDPDDAPLIEIITKNINPRTQKHIANINTPMVYYYMTRDYRGDGNTSESEAAYGIPSYNLLPSTNNYGEAGAPVQNVWALPYTLPYSSDPAFQYDDQRAFKEMVGALFFEFEAYVRGSRKPRIARMLLDSNATLPFLTEPVFGNFQDLKVHFFFDYEKPQIIAGKIGPVVITPPPP